MTQNVRFEHNPRWRDRSPRTQKFVGTLGWYGILASAAWGTYASPPGPAKLIYSSAIVLAGVGYLHKAWTTWQQSRAAKKPPQL